MKIKYLVGVLGLAVLLTVGVYYGRNALQEYKNVTATTKAGNEYVEQYNALVADTATLQQQLTTDGKDVFLDNTKVAELLAGLSGASIVSIDALSDANDASSVLVSITSTDDVAFFTDTVMAVAYTFTITDSTAFLNDLSNATFIAESASIDLENATARIVVPSSSALFAQLDTTSDATTSSSTSESDVINRDDTIQFESSEAEFENNSIPNEQSTETVVIPENSGVYDSTEMTESNTTGATESNTTGSTEEFNGNYYVIESTEE